MPAVIELAALRSRFGRRLLLLFVTLALVPILTLAFITYRSVTLELAALSEQRLRSQTKAHAMSILERLALLDGELALLAVGSTSAPPTAIPLDLEQPIAVRFKRLSWVVGEEEGSIHGGLVRRPALSLEQRLHLARERALLVLADAADTPRLLLARTFATDQRGVEGELWSEIDPSYLWWGRYRENHLPAMTELCAVQPTLDRTLMCSSEQPADLTADIRLRMRTEAFGEFGWSRAGERHQAQYRTLKLDDLYGHTGFTVVLSESVALLGGPLRDFRVSFLPIVLTTLWVVLLLSIRQIRRGLKPLEMLREGTAAIAEREFSTRVQIASGDEFEDLAGSFNLMAQRLGTQFEALGALTEIQSSVLSADGRAEIAAAVLTRLGRLLPSRVAQLAVLDPAAPQQIELYSLLPGGRLATEEHLIHAEDTWWLQESSEIRIVDRSERLPGFLSSLRSGGEESVAVVPIVLESRIAGVLAASLEPGKALSEDDFGPMRQLGDQIAQALSKAALIAELEELGLGTLQALARTIDANSRWTLGHSERVAELATRLGRKMRLSKSDLDLLARGALLHDIGKLGVPASILDKPSKLTFEERQMIQRHVEIGVRILEPVPSLADVLPLVRQHHEWWDGRGYLEGLSGEEIHPLARLLAVVDVFDALRSPRPYRDALDQAEIRTHLREQAGKQFDPVIVGAFLELLGEVGAQELPNIADGAGAPPG